ncbi:MAG: hypothetical protein AB1531_03590 [Chloroflexota bacterium]
MKRLIPLFLILMISLAACLGEGGLSTEQATQPPVQDGQGGDQGGDEQGPPADNALPPDPQEVAFQASDGRSLTGYYYPAAVNPAPVVVFMHWMGGDKSDWYELAPWLQNRGLDNPFPNPSTEPWWDPTWFPEVPAGVSYGVFIFSFRGCEPYTTGCASAEGSSETWLLDAQAAMQTAAGLEGVDPTKVVAIGSSIGADGAPDACAWLNEQTPGSCQGALSLSPGGYLDIPYPQAVQDLGEDQPPVAAWCLADESEFGICEAAEMVGNPAYQDFMIPGGGHGNFLLRPDLDPLPMQIILDFLAETVGP